MRKGMTHYFIDWLCYSSRPVEARNGKQMAFVIVLSCNALATRPVLSADSARAIQP